MLDKLKTKEVRDLYSVVFGHAPFQIPSSILLNYISINSDTEEFLLQLDDAPQSLQSFLKDTPKHIIGKYAEDLMSFYLRRLSNFEVALEHEQVIENGITISEIDYVLKENDHYLHWELSYKFYLEHNGEWIGPHARDKLSNKIDTVLNKQFDVIKSDALKKQVPNIPWSTVKSKLHIMGWAFKHGDTKNWGTSDSIWMKRKVFVKQDGGQDYWLIAEKDYWISPLFLRAGELKLYHWKELVPAFVSNEDNDKRAQLFVRLRKQHGNFIEIQRCFVVYDDWPN